MCIDADLNEESAKDLQFLLDATTDNPSEVLQTALREYADRIRREAKAREQAWLECGFIGCGEGPEDLSAEYKNHMGSYLDEKYPSAP